MYFLGVFLENVKNFFFGNTRNTTIYTPYIPNNNSINKPINLSLYNLNRNFNYNYD